MCYAAKSVVLVFFECIVLSACVFRFGPLSPRSPFDWAECDSALIMDRAMRREILILVDPVEVQTFDMD